jgi:methylated-DNA-[protein]-cysteine S-methyltransferase
MDTLYSIMDSPVGKLTLVAKAQHLIAILWEDDRPGRVRLGDMTAAENDPVLAETARQLQEYFSGERTCFDLRLDFSGTPFQCEVWRALLDIPFGAAPSYSEIANRIGRPRAVRAVGAAIGRNPISIVVPCHRVVGASGHLTGFAGGIAAKEILLALEGIEIPANASKGTAKSRIVLDPGSLFTGTPVGTEIGQMHRANRIDRTNRTDR